LQPAGSKIEIDTYAGKNGVKLVLAVIDSCAIGITAGERFAVSWRTGASVGTDNG
jgi:hypothetical protein